MLMLLHCAVQLAGAFEFTGALKGIANNERGSAYPTLHASLTTSAFIDSLPVDPAFFHMLRPVQ